MDSMSARIDFLHKLFLKQAIISILLSVSFLFYGTTAKPKAGAGRLRAVFQQAKDHRSYSGYFSD
jgi:hypothetical protein